MMSRRLHDSANRCFQSFKDKTARYATARWIVFFLLLGVFVSRVLVLQRFFVVAYGLGLYLIVRIALFWSPLNEETFVLSDERPRRVPEFTVWFACTSAVFVSYVMTLFSIFDIPTMLPILLGYFVPFALFYITRTILQRRWTSAMPTESDCVQIHLLIYNLHESPANSIVKITPWSALKTVPPFLKMSQTSWKCFLRDIDQAVKPTESFLRRVRFFLLKVIAICILCNMAFRPIYESPYFPCDPYQKCNRALWVGLIVMAAMLICTLAFSWLIIVARKEELISCSERVKQIYEEVRAEYPQVQMDVKLHTMRGKLVVEVRAASSKRDTETVPNPNTSATDPLLETIV